MGFRIRPIVLEGTRALYNFKSIRASRQEKRVPSSFHQNEKSRYVIISSVMSNIIKEIRLELELELKLKIEEKG